MRHLLIGLLLLFIHASAQAQEDNPPRPGDFDGGYLFIGPGDVLKFKGYAQVDTYLPFGNSPNLSEFLVRRARFAVTGFFHEKFRYMLYVRMDRGKVELNEAFLESRHLPFARFRVGQFKVPFSQSNLQSSAQIDFVSRAFMIENFSPAYDIGAMVFGEDKQKIFNYATGLFNGEGRNKPENNNGKTVIGRVVLMPFASFKSSIVGQVHLGASFSHGRQKNNFSKASYKLPTESAVLSYSDSVQQGGSVTIFGYDLEWLIKNVGIRAEYLRYTAENLVRNGGAANLKADGYYLAATYVLTGEGKKSNANVKPNKPLDAKRTGWGAFELAARYEMSHLPDAALLANLANGTNGLHAATAGINWYVNDDVKVVLNYTRYVFNQPINNDGRWYTKSHLLQLRFQYQF
ncbi:OprO/OprP family phosphate-selective porin [Spirosoma sp. 209]|uniref:OprO/OprP family phosphate-selective porin n=1 Tax=Spirosoma sp. 209 TaxID=1955701 RepID=UPI00137481E8|nr:porin [Spirosoma sp. 209]